MHQPFFPYRSFHGCPLPPGTVLIRIMPLIRRIISRR